MMDLKPNPMSVQLEPMDSALESAQGSAPAKSE
jgi:hypothetical protein